jgi:insertion element IS1 protein InsB
VGLAAHPGTRDLVVAVAATAPSHRQTLSLPTARRLIVITAAVVLERHTGQLLDWECGRRDKTTLKKLVDRLAPWDVKLYCTDRWATYASVIPQDNLVQSKATTRDIERNHCRQRHWFGRFKRKSIMVSKSKEMVDLTMALFAKFWVNGNQDELVSLLG